MHRQLILRTTYYCCQRNLLICKNLFDLNSVCSRNFVKQKPKFFTTFSRGLAASHKSDCANRFNFEDVNSINNNVPDNNNWSNAGVNKFVDRSHTCGEIDDTLLEQEVCLCGWVEYQRLNKFIVLRDSYGTVQLFVRDKQLQNVVKQLNFESVIRVKGKVMSRPAKDINPEQKNGNVEVCVEELVMLNNSKATLPILIRDHANVTEPVRLQYRYIDLRRPKMIENLRLRSRFVMSLRNCLADQFGFVEVETPTLFKATPGGAQEFIVPTRFANQFYSLVQSPQQFKQLLMVGGVDRYFQIARCYRDEGTKSDRQPEFTQLDIEMSFTTMDNVMSLIEQLLVQCWPIAWQKSQIVAPFARIDYFDAMERYGCDKPDLRRPDIEIKELIDEADSSDGRGHYLLVIPQDYDESFTVKSFIEEDLNVQINTLFFKGQLNYFKLSSMPFNEPDLNEEIVEKLTNDKSLKENDFIWIASGSKVQCKRLLGRIRAYMIDRIEEDRVVNRGHQPKLSLLWVKNFPLFLENEETGQLESSHHPFTAPKPTHGDLIYTDPAKVIGQNFDLVINGREMGGGSIRIVDHHLQRYILGEVLGCDNSSMEYFFEALNSGCPPHGGFAIGLDRLVALLCHEPSLRDVIAFPKSAQGKDLMADSPSPVDRKVQQLYRIVPS